MRARCTDLRFALKAVAMQWADLERGDIEKGGAGYLFEDLHSMARIEKPVGKTGGGVGYPMVATALAGIELFGCLTTVEEFDSRPGKTRHAWPNGTCRR